MGTLPQTAVDRNRARVIDKLVDTCYILAPSPGDPDNEEANSDDMGGVIDVGVIDDGIADYDLVKQLPCRLVTGRGSRVSKKRGFTNTEETVGMDNILVLPANDPDEPGTSIFKLVDINSRVKIVLWENEVETTWNIVGFAGIGSQQYATHYTVERSA